MLSLFNKKSFDLGPSPVRFPCGAGWERNEVTTIFEDVEEDMEIPIYDIPVQRT